MAENNEMEVVNKPYTLRNVQATDIFSMIKIIRKVGVKNIADAFNTPQGENENNRGWAILDVIFERLPYCENEVYEFLSRLSGMEANEIATLDPDMFMMMIFDVIDQPKFKDFLKVAWGRL